jgi:diacylglycerol kinase (ATP)
MNQPKYKSRSKSWLLSRRNSFRFAIKGILYLFRSEPHAWIHLVFTILVFILTVRFGLTAREMAPLVIVIGLVWMAELFNTAIERIVDFISPSYHRQAGIIKDMAAGAVLIAALTAVVTGAIIFLPKIF